MNSAFKLHVSFQEEFGYLDPMPILNLKFLLLVLPGLVTIHNLFGWANHHTITHTALSALPALKNRMVVYEKLDVSRILKGFDVHSIEELCRKIQIKKEYGFQPRLGEIPGKNVVLLDVLAKYSDEPDWGMDRELFYEDQYPELYGLHIAFMGGKKGTASQFFRHAYLPQDWLSPILSLKAPYPHTSMGAADQRGALFVELSQLAAKNGSPYWAARFLACSLHYISDVSQPFHTAQVPTKQYLWMSIPALFHGKFISTVIRIISYYHWAYERTIGAVLDQRIGTEKQRERFFLALTDQSFDHSFSYQNMQRAVQSAAEFSLSNAGVSGRESILFFPLIPKPLAEFDPKAFMDSDWWKDIDRRLKEDIPIRDHYLSTVESMFRYLGTAIRKSVEKELHTILKD